MRNDEQMRNDGLDVPLICTPTGAEAGNSYMRLAAA